MSKLYRLASRIGEVPRDAVDRVGGEPIGMTKEMWPLCDGEPMKHVITLGRNLIVHALPKQMAAVAVFINSIDDNEAYAPDTDKTRVVFLTRQDLERGTTSAEEIFGAPLEGDLGAAGTVVMAASEYDYDEVKDLEAETAEDDGSPEDVSYAVGPYMQEQLDTEIDGLRVNGLSAEHAWWLQYPEGPEDHRVLFWFYDELVPGLNCGGGAMYVTADEGCREALAWWQS
jgi:hypothetical protein